MPDRPDSPSALPASPFRLTRHFSLTSLAGVLVVMACLLLFYREHTTNRLAQQVGQANADVTRLLANMLWPQYGGLVVGPAGRERAELLADPRQARLMAEMRAAMRGLNLVKLKIYDIDGLTVFSTDPAQVGDRSHDSPQLLRARAGEVVSAFTHRDRFHALEGELFERDLIASYVPISVQPGQGPVAVFEVYADVTERRQAEAEAWRLVAGSLLLALGALYLFLLATVRRADRVMAAQERSRAEHAAQVQQMAFHDGLTGLPNRRSFGQRFAETLAQARRQGHRAALLFIDLDGFKAVNDALGHAAGDATLQAMAGRLQACLREGELLFRMGGDEFTVVLPRVATADEAAMLARRLTDVASQPVVLASGEVLVGASIGIALYPDHAAEADLLLRLADNAMYAAKARGRGAYAVHGGPGVPAPPTAPMAPRPAPSAPTAQPA
jgi:diguanylate cyclase (GGDEF)-like protein